MLTALFFALAASNSERKDHCTNPKYPTPVCSDDSK